MMAQHGRTVSLGEIPLFANLPPRSLEELLRASRCRTYPQGQILFHEGDPGMDLVVLESGHLKISRYLADGTDVVLSVLEAPAVLGELALLDGAPRSATVTAQRLVSVRLIPRAAFQQLLEREPLLARGVIDTLVAMVRQGNERHADFVGLDVPGRLAKWLLKRSRGPRETSVPPGTCVLLHASQAELAAELGTTRSTLNRTLRDFESLRLIEVVDGHVRILLPERLESYSL